MMMAQRVSARTISQVYPEDRNPGRRRSRPSPSQLYLLTRCTGGPFPSHVHLHLSRIIVDPALQVVAKQDHRLCEGAGLGVMQLVGCRVRVLQRVAKARQETANRLFVASARPRRAASAPTLRQPPSPVPAGTSHMPGHRSLGSSAPAAPAARYNPRWRIQRAALLIAGIVGPSRLA